MRISGTDLAKLAEFLPALKFATKYIPGDWDDKVVQALEKIGEDQELLDGLAAWLNWGSGLFNASETEAALEPDLPACLSELRTDLEAWRVWLRDVD